MKKTLSIIVLFALFIIDLVLVLTNNTTFIDDTIYSFIISFKSSGLTEFFKIISFLASTKFIIFLNAIIIILCLFKKQLNWLFITYASISSAIVNNLVKFLVKRSRPFNLALVEETFYSFPSGHTMISILFYGSLIYMINQSKMRHKKIIISIISIYILLVGISRIYLGVHYASDVIGGYLLALSMLLLFTKICEKYSKERIK